MMSGMRDKIYSWMLDRIQIPLPSKTIVQFTEPVLPLFDDANLVPVSQHTITFGVIEPTFITMANLPSIVDAVNCGRWIELYSRISLDLPPEYRARAREYGERDLKYQLAEHCEKHNAIPLVVLPFEERPDTHHTYRVTLQAFVVPQLTEWKLP